MKHVGLIILLCCTLSCCAMEEEENIEEREVQYEMDQFLSGNKTIRMIDQDPEVQKLFGFNWSKIEKEGVNTRDSAEDNIDRTQKLIRDALINCLIEANQTNRITAKKTELHSEYRSLAFLYSGCCGLSACLFFQTIGWTGALMAWLNCGG